MTSSTDDHDADQSSIAHDRSEPTSAVPQGDTRAIPSRYTYPEETGSGTMPAAAQVPGPPDPIGPADAGVPFSDDTTPRGPRRRTGLLVGGIAAVVVLGGAAAFGVAKLSGGGAQPADVLPGDAYAYVRLDIDPSAGQKIAAVRFLQKIPQLKETVGSEDMRRDLWERAVAASPDACLKKFDFSKDIDPWLGQRAGFALRPGKTGDNPNLVLALQVSDEETATDTLTRLLDCTEDSSDTDIRARDGYVLLTPRGQGDLTMGALDKGSLAGNASFEGDMKALGDQGVASMWFDLSRLTKELNASLGAETGVETGTLPDSVTGRTALALRFDADYIEMAGVARGVNSVKKADGNGAGLTSLPDDTVAALQLSGGDGLADSAWPEIQKMADQFSSEAGMDDPIPMIEQQLGITLPDDLKVLLGKSFTVSLPEQEFGAGTPVYGFKVTGTDAQKAEQVLTSIEDASGGALLLTKKVDGDRLYVGSTPDYAARLAQTGKLGDSDAFKAALGDTSRMNAGLYVDLDRVEKYYLDEVDQEAREAVRALRAVGYNVSITGDGEGTFSFRVVGN